MYPKDGGHPKLFCGDGNVGAGEEFLCYPKHPGANCKAGYEAFRGLSLKGCKSISCNFTHLKHPALIPEGHGAPLAAA